MGKISDIPKKRKAEVAGVVGGAIMIAKSLGFEIPQDATGMIVDVICSLMALTGIVKVSAEQGKKKKEKEDKEKEEAKQKDKMKT